jgi:hypothetical protein
MTPCERRINYGVYYIIITRFHDNILGQPDIPNFFLLAKLEKCIPSHLLSLWGEDEGKGDIFRLHPHPNPLPPAGEEE